MSFRSTLPTITPFTFGTGNVSDIANPEHIAVTQHALDDGVWFHSSHAYGNGGTFRVLAEVFKRNPGRVPKCIFKVDGQGPDLLREAVDEQIRGTGVERIDIAQVCGNPAYDELKPGRALHDTMVELKERGLVGSYVCEIFWGFSPNVMRIVEDDLFDGYTYYHNVVNREVSNELYDLLQARGSKILSIRATGGGPDCYWGPKDGEAAKAALDDILARSGCATKLEFRLRYILSVPNVVTTIGATSKLAHLNEMVSVVNGFTPLDPAIVAEIDALHRVWFGTHGLS